MAQRKLIWITMSVIVVGAGVYYFFFRSGASDEVTYRWEKIDRGDVMVTISATATLNAVTTVQVGSQVSGTISRLYADFNSSVREGDILAQLDPTFLQAAVNEQSANVDRASAQVEEAKRTLARANQLFERKLVSQAELDGATTAKETSSATLRQSQAALERARVNLRYATVNAPISGVVISRNVDVGQTVAASLQAPTLFTIAQDLRKMQALASVDEADVGSVKIGQPVTFRVDSYPDEEFSGLVSQVRLAPVITQNVVTYTVVIDANNPDQRLLPGMTATVSIHIAGQKDVMRAPLAALRFSPDAMRGGPGDASAMGGGGMGRGAGAGTLGARTGASSPQRSTKGVGRAGKPESDSGNPQKNEPANSGADLKSKGRLWVMKDGQPASVSVSRGLQNMRYVELTECSLAEGDSVIVGLNAQASTMAPAQTNPFAPRMGGGGGGRGRGF